MCNFNKFKIMKKVILSMLLIVGACLTIQAQKNLIPNGDMSKWGEESPMPEGFFVDSLPNSQKYFVATKVKYNEKPSLKLTFKNKSKGSSRYFATPYTKLLPGKYQLTFYLRGTGFIRSANLSTREVSNEYKRSAMTSKQSASNMVSLPMGPKVEARTFEDWTKFTVTYNVTEEGEYNVSIANNNFDGDPKNPLWISGISLEKK